MIFLIGHRGVGKTSVAIELGGLDLDAEISKTHDIDGFFKSGSEAAFRKVEIDTLQSILDQKNPSVISLGAGFDFEKFKFPVNSKIIWLQRKSDRFGRVFLDRPRLNSTKSPLDEFKERFEEREFLYAKFSDFQIELEEGSSESAIRLLTDLLKKQKVFCKDAYFTLTAVKYLDFVSGNLELRNDLLSDVEIVQILKERKGTQLLVAIRKLPSATLLEALSQYTEVLVDLSFEFRDQLNFDRENTFYSSHSIDDLDEITKMALKGHVKWAPVVTDFSKLIFLHEKIKNLDISFLPRTENTLVAKWNWYRQLRICKNKINFYRFGLSEYLDQPSYFEMESLNKGLKSVYGGLVGVETSLSRSPAFHREFFKEQFKSTYLNIPLDSDEFTKENLDFLFNLGVTSLSVTAPFKEAAAELVGGHLALNTLCGGLPLKGADTDSLSISHLIEGLKGYESVLIWGAGAVGKLVFQALGGKKAKLCSVREHGAGMIEGDFDVVIWCAGPEAETPSIASSPKLIWDIEYKEHSRARSVALIWGSEYISGEEFFNVQALGQQKFWLMNKPENLDEQ